MAAWGKAGGGAGWSWAGAWQQPEVVLASSSPAAAMHGQGRRRLGKAAELSTLPDDGQQLGGEVASGAQVGRR